MSAWILATSLTTMAAAGHTVIAIDPGHGGAQEGAIGICGAKEKDVALAISRELARLIDALDGLTPYLTRDDDRDISLSQRVASANAAGATLFVSIHANASSNLDARGVETFFLSNRAATRRLRQLANRENDGVSLRAQSDGVLAKILGGLSATASHAESQRLAWRVQKTLNAQLSTHGRGVLQAPFVVLAGTEMPAVLIEVGFLTHRTECRLLADSDHQRAIARTIARAILNHLAADGPGLARK